MKFSDIKLKHIYYVIFDPVEPCEFNGKHLAVVLKINNDKNTFIVMPLTSVSNGVGINKIKLGNINNLPQSLRENETYAVFNQIRTVNANRLISLKENNVKIQAKLDDEVFNQLLLLGINDLLFNLAFNEKINIVKTIYQQECVNKAIELAYNILRLSKIQGSNEQIESIKNQIKRIIVDIPYDLEQKHKENGIDKI